MSHIEQFLDTNETLYFMKSMDCIKALREEAIQVSGLTHLYSAAVTGQGHAASHNKPRFGNAPFSLNCTYAKWK